VSAADGKLRAAKLEGDRTNAAPRQRLYEVRRVYALDDGGVESFALHENGDDPRPVLAFGVYYRDGGGPLVHVSDHETIEDAWHAWSARRQEARHD
jgi:hypothetical protein